MMKRMQWLALACHSVKKISGPCRFDGEGATTSPLLHSSNLPQSQISIFNLMVILRVDPGALLALLIPQHSSDKAYFKLDANAMNTLKSY